MIKIELNKKTNLKEFAKKLQSGEPTQIENVFSDETAEMIYNALDKDVEWTLTFKTPKGPVALSPAQIKRLPPQAVDQYFKLIHQSAAEEIFTYVFSTCPIDEAAKAGKPVNEVLLAFHAFLNTDEALDFFREASGDQGITRATCYASLFGPDQFITIHNDTDTYPSEDRRINCVFSFTKGWKPDWGGYLNFFDENNDIKHGFLPRFNVVTCAKLPAAHSVTAVAPFANASRFVIVSWFCGPDNK